MMQSADNTPRPAANMEADAGCRGVRLFDDDPRNNEIEIRACQYCRKRKAA